MAKFSLLVWIRSYYVGEFLQDPAKVMAYNLPLKTRQGNGAWVEEKRHLVDVLDWVEENGYRLDSVAIDNTQRMPQNVVWHGAYIVTYVNDVTDAPAAPQPSAAEQTDGIVVRVWFTNQDDWILWTVEHGRLRYVDHSITRALISVALGVVGRKMSADNLEKVATELMKNPKIATLVQECFREEEVVKFPITTGFLSWLCANSQDAKWWVEYTNEDGKLVRGVYNTELGAVRDYKDRLAMADHENLPVPKMGMVGSTPERPTIAQKLRTITRQQKPTPKPKQRAAVVSTPPEPEAPPDEMLGGEY